MMFLNPRIIFKRSVATFGVFNNLILVFLIVSKAPKQLGCYKYLMLYISIFEILYSILDFLSVAEIYSRDSIFIIIIHNNLAILPANFLTFANVSFCSLFGMSMAIFAIHFVYRYLIVTGSRILQKNHFEKALFLIGFTILIGFLWSAVTFHFLKHNVYSNILLSNEYLKPRNMNLSDINYVGAHFHQIDENGNSFINWNSMIAVGLMTVVIFISSLIVFYCGYQIYDQMEIMASIQSTETKNLQSQLFWALVFQTLIPVFSMHIPASIGFITSMCNRSVNLLGEIITVTVFMYPTLDPTPNFFIIKSFRQAILEFFGCMRKDAVTPKSNVTNSLKLAVIAVAPN